MTRFPATRLMWPTRWRRLALDEIADRHLADLRIHAKLVELVKAAPVCGEAHDHVDGLVACRRGGIP